MWTTWLHLIVVHVPVLFSPLALFFLVRAMRSKAIPDYQLAYSFVIIAALTSAAAYFTGPGAADWLSEILTLEQNLLEDHALWGRVAFTVMLIAGVMALMAILAYFQEETPHPALSWGIAVLIFISSLMLIWTAHLGGLLRRPELVF
ncbi:MAG: hypothetical protein AAFP70_13430 [Calditrichota bacterium]